MEVFEHPSTSTALQNALKSALPYSITLAYRTQHSNRTEHAHIIATFPSTSESLPKCWAAAYFDRSMRPETELWLFASGEMPNHSSSQDFCQECRRALFALLDYISTLPTPPMRADNLPALDVAYQHEREFPSPPQNGEYPPSPGTFMRHLVLPKVILVGSCHEQVVQIMRETGLVRLDMPGANSALNKFVFKLSALPTTRALPDGLRWGRIREQDIVTVKARTSIPRSTNTLLSLKSVGVFEEQSDRPVAWTFLGLDGSLTTLHTEPEHRGKGIAKAVAAKIMRECAPGLAIDDVGNTWAHADVYLGNLQSESVCRSLGGEGVWKDYWVRIDLEKAGRLAKDALST
jgi:ribosomal protein S18 acetylase RimI-like enzyme